MRRIAIILSLARTAQARDNVKDNMLARAFAASSPRGEDMENSTLGKLGLARQVQTTCSATVSTQTFGKTSTAKEVVDAFAPQRQLAGRVALVTGGNSGIGLETVKALAHGGCRVILATRSVDAGDKAVKDEVRQLGLSGYSVDEADIAVKPLDLADISSVVSFAQDVAATEPRLDYLVLNAGVMALPNLERTAAGFEAQIGVNHFGHALLTRLLLSKLESQDHPSRIVVLSSTAHKMANSFDVDNLHYTGSEASGYSAWGSYGRSKLANLFFAKALSTRVSKNIAAVSVHPGVIRTPLWRHTMAGGWIGGALLNRLMCDKDVPQGASTTLWACLSPEAGSQDCRGAYLADCAPAPVSELAQDPQLPDALWKATEAQLDAALAQRGFDPSGAPLDQ